MKRNIVIVVTVTSFILVAMIGIFLIVRQNSGHTPSMETVTGDTTKGVSSSAESAPAEATDTEEIPATQITTTTASESTPAPTVKPVEGVPTAGSRSPVIFPPEPSGKPCTFYNDAAFIGDSVSVMLTWYAQGTGLLGDPLFLTKECYGIAHAVGGSMLFDYNGTQMAPEDILAAAGVKKVFIMLGMNDIGYSTDYIMNGWRTVIGRIREKCPDIKIYIQSCTPIWTGGERGALTNENMNMFNGRLKEVAEELGCTFVDVAPYFKDSTGGLATEYCSDSYVHLTNAGVAAWTKFLIAYGEAAS